MTGIVFVPYSARGHVNPVLPVAAELVDQGVRVRVVAGEKFGSALARAGAEHVVPDGEPQPWSPPSWNPMDLVQLAQVRLARVSALRSVTRRCSHDFRVDRPDVVVADPMAPAPARVAWDLGIPVVWLSTTHARSATARGVTLVNSVPELQPRRSRFGPQFRFVGPLLAPRGPREGVPGAGPSLLVSPGTVFARSTSYFRWLVGEFAHTEWTVWMATGHLDPAELGPLPTNVVARRWLPQRAFLTGVTAFLTHGGMNSVQEALIEDVPMLLAPRNAEQRATARCLVELDLARLLTTSAKAAVEGLAGDPRVRNAVADMGLRLRQRDGATLAAETLCLLLS